jgi:peptidoglycan hydrolase CwlO-like protein
MSFGAAPLWNPGEVLAVNPYDGGGCWGITQKGSRCRQPFMPSPSRAEAVLHQISYTSPKSETLHGLLEKLGQCLYCPRWHGDPAKGHNYQVPEMVVVWEDKIAAYNRSTHLSATRQSQMLKPIPSFGKPHQQDEVEDLRSAISLRDKDHAREIKRLTELLALSEAERIAAEKKRDESQHMYFESSTQAMFNIASLKIKASKVENDNDELRREVSTKTSDLKRLESRLGVSEARLVERDFSISIFQRQIKEISAEKEKLTDKNSGLSRQLSDLYSQLEAKSSESLSQVEEIHGLRSHNAELHTGIKDLSIKFAQLESQVSTQQQWIKDLMAQNHQAELSIDDLFGRNEDLKHQMDAAQTEICTEKSRTIKRTTAFIKFSSQRSQSFQVSESEQRRIYLGQTPGFKRLSKFNIISRPPVYLVELMAFTRQTVPRSITIVNSPIIPVQLSRSRSQASSCFPRSVLHPLHTLQSQVRHHIKRASNYPKTSR